NYWDPREREIYHRALAQATDWPAEGRPEWRPGDVDGVRAGPRPRPPDLRPREWHYPARQGGPALFRRPPARGFLTRLATAAGGTHLAAGTEDGALHVWPRDGGPVRKFQGHEGPVLAAAFSPDGRRLASAGADGKVILREVADGTQVAAWDGKS